MGEEKEYIIVERGLPGFQPRRDYRAKLKSRNGDVCEPVVPRRLALFLSSPPLPWPLVCRRPRILMKEPVYLCVSRTVSVGTQGGCFERHFSKGNKEISGCRGYCKYEEFLSISRLGHFVGRVINFSSRRNRSARITSSLACFFEEWLAAAIVDAGARVSACFGYPSGSNT